MRHVWIFAQPIRRISTLRRGLEYAAAIGLAIFSSYWIVRGRW
jgi:hypothetical protein